MSEQPESPDTPADQPSAEPARSVDRAGNGTSQTPTPGWINRLQPFAPIDLLPLACFRIFFGAMMLYHVASYVNTTWLEYVYIGPEFHFTYPGFTWVKALPGRGMYIPFAVMGVTALGIMTGCFYRVCMTVFAFSFTYVFLLEKALYQNHYYLICLLSGIMIFVPAHRLWSIDAIRTPGLKSQTAPRIWLWLVRFQIAIPYVYGGFAKLNSDWLHGMPTQMWAERRSYLPIIGPWLGHDYAGLVMSWAGLIFDLLVVPALMWRPTRLIAYACALLFHLMNTVLWEIGIFPWFMIGATLVFFPPDSLRKSLFRRGIRQSTPDQSTAPLNRKQRIVIATVGVYVTWQLLFPFRHFLFPGNASWTEEAHYFAWHMMLREKKVGMQFFVREAGTEEYQLLDIPAVLTERQLARMGKDPDMILDFLGYIREQRHQRGASELEIRALVLASLNGRKPQLLMDPERDYASVERIWGPQPWIVPLHEPLRSEPWQTPVKMWEAELAPVIPDDLKSSGN